MSLNNLNKLKKLLLKLGAYLKNHTQLNQLKLKESMLVLESIFSSNNLSLQKQNKLISYLKENDLLSIFQKNYEKYEINLEKEFAESFIKKNSHDKNTLKKYHFYSGYLKAVKKEAKLAKIKISDKICFVGSGPMPMTAILLQDLTGANIDCVEKEEKLAKLSKNVIHKLAYNKDIKVINNDALKIDFSPYSVIILAVLAKPKEHLMKIIWERIQPKTRIIYRLPSIARQAYYEDTSNILNVYSEFEKKRIIGKGTSILVLLIKN